jgi:glycosyltransferase involved in cell wall biosynthesis
VSAPPTPVAVVIATRDRPELVQRAVRSALAQTQAPAEVVVVDDGSDPPLELAPALAVEERVRLVRLQPGGGAGAARNTGVAKSSAPLVAFLDDDDEWRPDKLARQVAALDGLPDDVAAVDCGYELREPGRPVWRSLPDPERQLRRTLLERPALMPSSLLIRRQAFDDLGGFQTAGLPRTEDWEFALRLTDRFRVGTVAQVLVSWNRSQTPPHVLLDAYRIFLTQWLEPRLADLPPGERARVRSWHQLVEGVYLAQAGRGSEARALLWRAWRTNPRSLRPVFQLGRTVLGERTWNRLKRLAATR